MNKSIQKNLLTTLLFVSSSSVIAAPEMKGTPDELRAFLHPESKTVMIRGDAEEIAFSDLAHVTIIVTTKEQTMTEALQQNSELRAGFVERFVRSGISPDRINNAQFSSSPQYGWFGRKPKEYEVVNRLKVTVDGEDQLKLLSETADQYEEASVGGIEFEHSEKEAFEEKVKEAALDDAITSSSKYATKLGLELTPVSFRFVDVRPRRPYSSGIIEEVVVTATKARAVAADTYVAPPVTFDEVEYKSIVEVVFEVSSETE